MLIKRIGTTENPLFQHQDGKVYDGEDKLIHDREAPTLKVPVAEPEATPETEA